MARTKTAARLGVGGALVEAERAYAAADEAERKYLASLGLAVREAERAYAVAMKALKGQAGGSGSQAAFQQQLRIDVRAAMLKRERARRAFNEAVFKRSEDEPGAAVAKVWKAAVAAAVALDPTAAASSKVKAEPAE